MPTILRSLILGAAMLATPALATSRDTPEMRLEKMLAGRVAGKPVDCIDLSSASSSTIIDGKAIVYRVGSTLYVNTPRSYPQSLRSDDVLITRTFGSQLCSTDVVHTADRLSGFPRSPVFLGKFVPYTKPKAPAR
ncbi:hypothetical protein [Sphingomonas xinjiangensis]|uniref:Uncharacterized protein n=1 Tax=Sphingomonas xinjiangensis TaxID=643568 RepID=A0A840YQ94_9SPHN|nr:hypothetical protein [Sphingomonas xinjiangensis]MBB5710223.1 hypothetical protein [Sphingomonas xinjiangensis]